MDAQFRDRAVYLPAEETLVVADLHVGRDAASAVELPLGERADLTDRLSALLAAFDPREVVVAGDLLHAFDRIPEGVAETVAALGETVALYGPESYRGGDVLMVPAFNRLAPGVTVNGMSARDFQSPLVRDVDALRPVVWDSDSDEALSFPPLGEFRRML